MKTPTEKQIASLPKWAQQYIEHLKLDAVNETQRRERLEAMLPWTFDGMDWFTLFRPPHRQDREIRIFTCDDGGTAKLCTLGRRDFLFIGRSKERDL